MIIISTVSNIFRNEATTSYIKMFSLGILVVLPNILAGMSESYSSIALPDMNLDVHITSWFASIGGYCGFIGILLVGLIIDLFGRKITLLLSLVPHIVGWTLLYWNNDIFTIILGRALTGLTAVSMFYAPQVYAVECITVNHARLRSNFRVWPGIANSIGSLLIFFSGSFFTYREVCAAAALLALLIFLLIFICLPESPAWLYMRGRIGDAEMSERKLGIIQPILQTTNRSGELPEVNFFRLSWSNIRKEAVKFGRRDVYKPVIVLTVLCALIMLTGGVVMTSYQLQVIGLDADNASASVAAHCFSVVSGLMILVAHIGVSLALPYLGCRKMSIFGGLFMCAGMVILGLTTDNENGNRNSNDYMWHVVAVWLTTFSFHFGVLSAPIAVMSDLFAVDSKGFACFAILTMSLCGAFVTQTYPFLSLFYAGGVYYGYAVICLLYALFLYSFMPETVGRTYEEIRNDLIR